MTIDSWIAAAAQRHPDKTAIEFHGAALSYCDFLRRIEARAAELTEAGVGRGDRVAWYGLNQPEVFVLLFACARIGATFVPLNWRLAEAEIATIVRNCGPRIVFHDDHYAEAAVALSGVAAVHFSASPGPLGDRAAPVQGGTPGLVDPVLIVYTSGSTGLPKGAVLRQSALVSNAKMSVHGHELTPDSRVFNALPMFHVGGLNILPVPAFSIGATVHLHERFEPVAAVHELPRVTHAITVPTVLQAMLAVPDWAAADLSGLVCLSIGSTDVPVSLLEQVHARGVPVIQIYGATETSPFAIYQTASDAIATLGSIGHKGIDCEIRLVRPDGTDCGLDEPGEIWVRGDNVLAEYWGDPDLSARQITDGWFHTGDVARLDGDGLYWFTDRIKHVIISGGENIYPAEVERVLREHPAVTEVAVVGRPHPKWGEEPVAVAVRRGPVTDAEFLGMLQGRIARYKQPRAVVWVDALPRNAMGKVVAARVREMIAAL